MPSLFRVELMRWHETVFDFSNLAASTFEHYEICTVLDSQNLRRRTYWILCVTLCLLLLNMDTF